MVCLSSTRLFRLLVFLIACASCGYFLQARESKIPLALEAFDEVWRILNENHFDTNFNGHDWNEVRGKFRPRAAAAPSTPAFHEVVQEMLDLLDVSHLAIVSGEESEIIEAEEESTTAVAPAEESDSGTLGLELRYDEDALLVTRVEAGLPAEKAGIKPGWILKGIGSISTAELKRKTPKKLDERRRNFLAWRAVSKKLSGFPGSAVALEFLDGNNRTIRVRLERSVAQGVPIQFGALPVLYAHLDSSERQTAARKKVGIIRFNIWMLPTALAFNKAIDEHRDKDALVLDLRGNIGGMVGMIIGVAGHFTLEPIVLGTMIDRANKLRLPANPRLVDTSGKRVEPFSGPVAILVDEITASASEVFTGGLQENKRVRVFGRTTAGQALPAVYHRLANGDTLYHPIADFITASGTRFEGRGVIPDEPVPLNRAALLIGRDPALESALKWVDSTR